MSQDNAASESLLIVHVATTLGWRQRERNQRNPLVRFNG